ncbi:putative Rab3 GTPase-activating protein catalytic subunit [Blattamonas nauphoetae]|uniref:Rab3 GTPase-activating protein catalytic subunit n=1 Tax=Blattamonas nauphoetae TaxID=2049346 RepID=A0ABQ9XID2_9EUKA|nr:putative Rab3 GTPase-activating protein catalytic subunit [Blattamonas nauphoetae]
MHNRCVIGSYQSPKGIRVSFKTEQISLPFTPSPVPFSDGESRSSFLSLFFRSPLENHRTIYPSMILSSFFNQLGVPQEKRASLQKRIFLKVTHIFQKERRKYFTLNEINDRLKLLHFERKAALSSLQKDIKPSTAIKSSTTQPITNESLQEFYVKYLLNGSGKGFFHFGQRPPLTYDVIEFLFSRRKGQISANSRTTQSLQAVFSTPPTSLAELSMAHVSQSLLQFDHKWGTDGTIDPLPAFNLRVESNSVCVADSPDILSDPLSQMMFDHLLLKSHTNDTSEHIVGTADEERWLLTCDQPEPTVGPISTRTLDFLSLFQPLAKHHSIQTIVNQSSTLPVGLSEATLQYIVSLIFSDERSFFIPHTFIPHSAPCFSLLSRVVSIIVNQQGRETHFAVIWKAFVDQLIQQHYRAESIPHLRSSTVLDWETFEEEEDCDLSFIDNNDCLLQQKLEILNYCIWKKKARNFRKKAEQEQDKEAKQKMGSTVVADRVLEKARVDSESPSVPLSDSIFDELLDPIDSLSITPLSSQHSQQQMNEKAGVDIPFSIKKSTDKTAPLPQTVTGVVIPVSTKGLMPGQSPEEGEGRKTHPEGMKLLGGGDMWYPYTQNSRPLMLVSTAFEAMNGDSDSDSEDEQPGLNMISMKILQSDIQSFKAANPLGCLDDFVRWYSPPDWVIEQDGAEISVDPKQIEPIDGATPHLSSRFTSSDSTNTWLHLWSTTTALTAAKQQPLFNDELQAEMALTYLQTITPSKLFCQLWKVWAELVYSFFFYLSPLNYFFDSEVAKLNTLLTSHFIPYDPQRLANPAIPRSSMIKFPHNQQTELMFSFLKHCEFSASVLDSLVSKTRWCLSLCQPLFTTTKAVIKTEREKRGILRFLAQSHPEAVVSAKNVAASLPKDYSLVLDETDGSDEFGRFPLLFTPTIQTVRSGKEFNKLVDSDKKMGDSKGLLVVDWPTLADLPPSHTRELLIVIKGCEDEAKQAQEAERFGVPFFETESLPQRLHLIATDHLIEVHSAIASGSE